MRRMPWSGQDVDRCRRICVLISTTHYHGRPGLGEILTRIRTERANCRFATQKVGKLTMRTVRQRANQNFEVGTALACSRNHHPIACESEMDSLATLSKGTNSLCGKLT